LLLFGLTATGSELLPSVAVGEIDKRSQTEFVRADALLQDGQWEAAVAVVQAAAESAGNQLVRVPNSATADRLGFANYVTVRQQANHWFASLGSRAPEALAIYRRQVDPVAEHLYRDGIAAFDEDEDQLRRIVDEMFASTFGDDALLRLGELARQRGAYTLARNYWQRIAGLLRYIDMGERGQEGGDAYPWWLITAGNAGLEAETAGSLVSPTWLSYPDSDLNLDEVRARLVLLSILDGSRRRAELELEQLRRTSPDAEGAIAGRQGKLVDLVDGFLAESEGWGESRVTEEWSTFGGSPRRDHRWPGTFDLGGRPIWTRALPQLKLEDREGAGRRLRVGERASGLLSIFPITMDGALIYAAGLHTDDIEAVDLHTGETIFPRRALPLEQEVPHQPGAPSVPRLTLTGRGSTLFALTLNKQLLPGRLVAVDAPAERKLLFAIELESPDWPGSWIFEGPPIVDGRSIYVAIRRIDQVRHGSHVACFDIRRGTLRWRRLVCEAETEPSIASGYLSNLLTLHEGTLYFNTNLGAVAALRADNGDFRWLVVYPRSSPPAAGAGENDLYRYRNLTPCLVHQDMIFVAPSDANRIFALDAITGTLIWSLPAGTAADVVHLLGVTSSQLIASGECLYWIDVETGRLQGRFPGAFHAAPGHARPSPRGYGRGLLAGNEIYWPTRDAIYVFDQRTVKTDWGWQPRLVRRIELAARGATGGNLLLQDGILVIAAADSLYAFNESGVLQNVDDNRPGGR
jgi:outer membrane protein assembly factor BamB